MASSNHVASYCQEVVSVNFDVEDALSERAEEALPSLRATMAFALLRSPAALLNLLWSPRPSDSGL